MGRCRNENSESKQIKQTCRYGMICVVAAAKSGYAMVLEKSWKRNVS